MRSRHRGVGRPSIAFLVGLVAAFQCLFILGAGPASAVPTCAISSGTLTLTDDGAGLDVIDVWQDTAGKVFVTVGPLPGVTAPNGLCGNGIDLSAIQQIRIIGGTGISFVTIWMSQAFAATPATAPIDSAGPGADWGTMDWIVDLSNNADVSSGGGGSTFTFDGAIAVVSQSPNDPISVTAGSAGIDLDTDGDLDVTTVDVAHYAMQVTGGAGSTLSAAGGGATGNPVDGSVAFGGGAGDDTLLGGAGDDFFIDGSGDDTISGGAGEDVIFDLRGRDTIAGGAGDDAILSGPDGDVVDAGSGDDFVGGAGGNDQLSGGSGNDFLKGGRGDDLLKGDGGRDQCNGGEGSDVIHCEIARGRR